MDSTHLYIFDRYQYYKYSDLSGTGTFQKVYASENLGLYTETRFVCANTDAKVIAAALGTMSLGTDYFYAEYGILILQYD